ncbi:MAG: alpha/beta hydrolase [Bacteroidia bacterium]|nr:alpha/beta hydrolase [Bacteroidia bacterium]NNJ54507.1 alpha/beta hydrolase [Bacteroidia bacterium]
MKKPTLILLVFLIFACGNQETKNTETSNVTANPIEEKSFVKLGGEEQYVEITGASEDLPVLLFLHGGPGWPQTPHLRYFNADLAKEMIVVSWDQQGCGLTYLNNPNPKTLTVESLIDNAHELTLYLKKKFNKKKIYLLGFSFGSVLGMNLVEQYPENYHAYIGLSQLIDSKENFEISMDWLREQATAKQDTESLATIDLIDKRDTSVCGTPKECFMNKYWLLVKYNGTIYDTAIAKEIEKAEHYYQDYKDYDWFLVFNYTNARLGRSFDIDLTHIKSLDVPVYMLAGRHDWNLPGVVAERFLEKLEAPYKKFIWFDKSGHEPCEEEPRAFNETIIKIVKEKRLTTEE